MQYKLQVRNFIFVVLSLALLVGLASSVAAEALDTEGRWYQQQVTVTPQVQCTPVTYTATCVPKQACVQYTTQQICDFFSSPQRQCSPFGDVWRPSAGPSSG